MSILEVKVQHMINTYSLMQDFTVGCLHMYIIVAWMIVLGEIQIKVHNLFLCCFFVEVLTCFL